MGQAERPGGSGETQAHSVVRSAEEDGGCSASEVGESEAGSVTTRQIRLETEPSGYPLQRVLCCRKES